MANNYLVVNRPSGLVTGVVATSYSPTVTSTMAYLKAPDKTLERYYAYVDKLDGRLASTGELAEVDWYIFEQMQYKPFGRKDYDNREHRKAVDEMVSDKFPVANKRKDAEWKPKALEMHGNGCSIGVIAKHLSVHHSTVKSFIRRHHLSLAPS